MGGARHFLLGGKGQGMWGQILAVEGLLMDAWTITGGGGAAGGEARAWGAAEVSDVIVPCMRLVLNLK